VIRLNGIGLKYGANNEVLRNVTFHLRPGSFHFLTGPSGSGKTSLLRMLFMSLQATRGQIYVLGQDISRVAPAKRAQLRRRHVADVLSQHVDLATRRLHRHE